MRIELNKRINEDSVKAPSSEFGTYVLLIFFFIPK